MGKLNPAKEAWQKRKQRVRRRVRGSAERPRMNVYRSARHIYAQLIDDTSGRTIVAASTLAPEFKSAWEELTAQAAIKAAEAAPAEAEKGKGKGKKGKAGEAKPELKAKVAQARQIGLLIAKQAQEKGVRQIVFDRNGFLYHGRVKALAEGAREGGLEF